MFSIVPLILIVMVPHSILNFLQAMAHLCELANTDDILIIAL